MVIRLHDRTHTTPRIRAECQLATGSLTKHYGIKPNTVRKWYARTSVLDETIYAQDRAGQNLSQEQEHLPLSSAYNLGSNDNWLL
jgi:hypothetical protein